MITEPDDAIECEGEEVVFTCELNSNIEDDDVQWYGFMKNTSTTKLIPAGDNIAVRTHTGNTISSTLTITDTRKSYAGYYWVGTPSFNVCNVSLTVTTSKLIQFLIHNSYNSNTRIKTFTYHRIVFLAYAHYICASFYKAIIYKLLKFSKI